MLKKAERVAYIADRLQREYPIPPIPLHHRDAYTLLVSVLLSAQCTDERVNKVTPQLWSLADNPRDMAKQNPEAIREVIRPCGLAPAEIQSDPRLVKHVSRSTQRAGSV